MGGYGSGVHNKTHGRLEMLRRIDSYSFYSFLKRDKYLYCVTDVKYPVLGGSIIYHVKEKTAEIKTGNYCVDLGLSAAPRIDGVPARLYFHCPHCGRRVRYLYRQQAIYICRECAKLNYACQQKSGMDELRIKMERIVERKLQYAYWGYDYPDMPIQDLWHIPKPRYMRWEKYEKLMKEFMRLQNEYERKFLMYLSNSSFFRKYCRK